MLDQFIARAPQILYGPPVPDVPEPTLTSKIISVLLSPIGIGIVAIVGLVVILKRVVRKKK